MEVRDSVVVITGASSGIGRCTAQRMAQEGAKLVLASRNKKELKKSAKECQRAGGEAVFVECDVTLENDVENLADRALREFGRIDVWVNNAGVGLYARFEDAPSEAYRRMIESHLFGVIHGARAALRQFRAQGDRGILINVSSQVTSGGIPYQSGYAAAKSAIRMFDDTLRQELLESPDIYVCTVLPASTDTPFFQHAGNYTGRAIKPVGTISPPEDVAEAIVALVREPRRQVLIGKQGYAIAMASAIAPNLYHRAIRRVAETQHFQKHKASATEGNIFKPAGPEQIHGGWRKGAGGQVAPFVAAGAGLATLGILLARRAREQGRVEQAQAA